MSGPIIAQTTGMMLKEVQEEREGWEVLWSKTGIMRSIQFAVLGLCAAHAGMTKLHL
jgi:hypothetical protein